MGLGNERSSLRYSHCTRCHRLYFIKHFVRQQGTLELSLKGIGLGKLPSILKIGTPTFFIEVTAAMTILLFNYVLLHQFGENHIIAYGLTANIGVFALFVMVGIAQACQPIISFNHGANQPNRIEAIFRLGLKVQWVAAWCL